MRLSCESCGARIAPADINLEKMVAECQSCGAVFQLKGQPQKNTPHAHPPLPRGIKIESSEPSLPEGGTYRTAMPESDASLVITRRWFEIGHIFLLIFSVIWNIPYVVLFSSSVHVPRQAILFLSIPFVAGMFFFYMSLIGLFNKTTIRIANRAFSVRHGPLPWTGKLDIPTTQLRQLIVRSDRMRRSTRWELHAKTSESATTKILWDLEDRKQAEYIEWVIEQHLGIADVPAYSDSESSPYSSPILTPQYDSQNVTYAEPPPAPQSVLPVTKESLGPTLTGSNPESNAKR